MSLSTFEENIAKAENAAEMNKKDLEKTAALKVKKPEFGETIEEELETHVKKIGFQDVIEELNVPVKESFSRKKGKSESSKEVLPESPEEELMTSSEEIKRPDGKLKMYDKDVQEVERPENKFNKYDKEEQEIEKQEKKLGIHDEVEQEVKKQEKKLEIHDKEEQENEIQEKKSKTFTKEQQEGLSIVRENLKEIPDMTDSELLRLIKSRKRNILMSAVRAGNLKLTLTLLKLGASYEIADRKGLYPMHVAAEKGYEDILELLLYWGADINKLDLTGYTVLHRATLRGQTSMVKWILTQNINVNQTNRAGWTAMHLAACGGHLNIAKLLVKAGANVNARDQDGWTPLFLATLYKRNLMVDYLRSVGGI
nr:ankyrin repeat domain-containing protein 1-like isoform X2 [Halyomorpha halys]